MVGKTLKSYLLEEILGQGGMGVVYRGRDLKLGRTVAIKVLPADCVRDPERRRRFEQEARAAAAISHPAIAQVFEIGEEGDLVFIVMEYVDGSTVRKLVAAKRLDVGSCVEIAIPVAEALARAHEAGIVHRDIKSDNIMVTHDGHAKILDFGVAKLIPAQGGAGLDAATAIETVAKTQAGVVVGTLAYMSPEQARGLPVDRRSDVFSFGVVLHEMATGRLPFDGATPLDLLHAVAYEEPPAVTSIRPDVPYSLQRVIEKCLRKRPEDRYQGLRDAAADLRAVRREIEGGRPVQAPAAERLRRWAGSLQRRRALWVAAGGAAVLGLTLGTMLSSGGWKLDVLKFLWPAAGIGLSVYWMFRWMPQWAANEFVKKASALREVKAIACEDGRFTVVADAPTPRTYAKLNRLLSEINTWPFLRERMTLDIRRDADAPEIERIVTGPAVQYVRDDAASDADAEDESPSLPRKDLKGLRGLRRLKRLLEVKRPRRGA